MASVRSLKKDIDYLFQEVISDSYMTVYFHPEKNDEVIKLIEEAVDKYNGLKERANRPAEKNNKHLVKRHYAQLRRDLLDTVDGLFEKLSKLCK